MRSKATLAWESTSFGGANCRCRLIRSGIAGSSGFGRRILASKVSESQAIRPLIGGRMSFLLAGRAGDGIRTREYLLGNRTTLSSPEALAFP